MLNNCGEPPRPKQEASHISGSSPPKPENKNTQIKASLVKVCLGVQSIHSTCYSSSTDLRQNVPTAPDAMLKSLFLPDIPELASDMTSLASGTDSHSRSQLLSSQPDVNAMKPRLSPT